MLSILPPFSGRRARIPVAALVVSALACGAADSTANTSGADASGADIAATDTGSGGDALSATDPALADVQSDAAEDVQDDAQTAPSDVADDTAVDAQADADAQGSGPIRKTVNGSLAYTVTFTAEALAAGAKDCTYTRFYDAQEDSTVPWIFPFAATTFRGMSTVDDAACIEQIGGKLDYPLWLAVADDKYWVAANGGPSGNGPAIPEGDKIAISTDFTTDSATITAKGSLTIGSEVGPTADGTVPAGAYACGWPRANPPAYTGPYDLAVGATLPDGSFEDECGERVRLHDFQGSYLVIAFAASDCGPCQFLASIEADLVADLKGKGVDVRVITLIRPNLERSCIVGTKETITEWKTEYSIKDPVLLDRCYSASLQGNHGKDAGIWNDETEHMPTTIAVAPNLDVLAFSLGADYVAVTQAILEHAGK